MNSLPIFYYNRQYPLFGMVKLELQTKTAHIYTLYGSEIQLFQRQPTYLREVYIGADIIILYYDGVHDG